VAGDKRLKKDITVKYPRACQISGNGLRDKPVFSVMRQFVVVAEKLGLTYWFSAGTALGLRREKDGYIKYDSDIDVEVLAEPPFNENEFTHAMEKRGFCCYRRMTHKNKVMQLAFALSQTPLDVYFYYDYEDDNYININEHGVLELPKTFVEDRAEQRDFICPQPIERYLSHRFGKCWDKPTGRKMPWQDTAGKALVKWSQV
jgi:hypothetical protein